MIRLHWNNGRLMQGKRYMPIEVLPDHQWPGMYRVRYQGKISDLVNLTRAKDAAVALVEASLNALQKPRPFLPWGKGKSLISGLRKDAETCVPSEARSAVTP